MEQGPTSLTREVDAMAVIGQVLTKLTDPAARRRVLKWAAEVFAVDASAGAQAVVVPRVATPDPMDPGLAVDSLDEMFVIAAPEMDPADVRKTQARTPESSNLPVESVLRSFAEDFQRFTDEWNGATA